MNERNPSHFKPEGWHSVTTRIVARDAEQLVEFLKQTFGAIGTYAAGRPTVVTIDDSMLMVSDAGVRETTTAFLYVYVEDADKTYRHAVRAGATSVEQPSDMPYGDRRAMVKDRWGHTWQIATYRGR